MTVVTKCQLFGVSNSHGCVQILVYRRYLHSDRTYFPLEAWTTLYISLQKPCTWLKWPWVKVSAGYSAVSGSSEQKSKTQLSSITSLTIHHASRDTFLLAHKLPWYILINLIQSILQPQYTNTLTTFRKSVRGSYRCTLQSFCSKELSCMLILQPQSCYIWVRELPLHSYHWSIFSWRKLPACLHNHYINLMQLVCTTKVNPLSSSWLQLCMVTTL